MAILYAEQHSHVLRGYIAYIIIAKLKIRINLQVRYIEHMDPSYPAELHLAQPASCKLSRDGNQSMSISF